MKKLKVILSSSVLFFTYCTKETETVSGPYFPKVKSIISNHCLSCHSSAGTWEGRPTVFDTDEEITSAYASIKASIADSATIYNKRMPQSGMLSSSEIATIVKWFELGGKITD